MIIQVPDDWIRVSEEGLEGFLKDCNDYRSEGHANVRQYRFAHNNQAFAIIRTDGVWVHPDILLTPPKQNSLG